MISSIVDREVNSVLMVKATENFCYSRQLIQMFVR
jgi:hypothetical protein